MSWNGSNINNEKQLVDLFEKLSIDYSKPGFYDEYNFLQQEQKDPRFLEKYALYVESKYYDSEYLRRAERAIQTCADKLHKVIKMDGRLGACVDVSMMLSRMLEELGIWNYVTNSAVKIKFPPESRIKPIWFWAPLDGAGMSAAHAVVVAPPFAIIDLTLKMQPYEEGVSQYLPDIAYVKNYEKGEWQPEDVIEHDILHRNNLKGMVARRAIEMQCRPMFEVMNTFPCVIAKLGGTEIKYITIAIGGAQESLSGITGYKPTGRTALDIFEKDILPYIKD